LVLINMKIKEFHEPVKPDTYEASMALNQIMKIGKHAIKLHKLIDDRAEMEAWVQKKIDLAGDYVKKVHGYMQGQDSGLYDDGGLTEGREEIGDYAREIKSGKIVRIVDYTDDDEGIYTISYGDGKGETDVTAKSLKFLDQTGRDQEEIGKFDEDAGSLTDEQKKGLQMIHKKYDGYFGNNMDPLVLGYMKYRLSTGVGTDGIEEKELEAALKKYGYDTMYDAEQADDDFYDKINNKEHLPITTAMKSDLDKVMGSDFNDDGKLEMASEYLQNMGESVSEDAGEGHMSKSTLYHTAKYAIELASMIKPGDDLEGWVQSKLNKAADYLQGAYNYEEYQKLNPYREELDSNTLNKHAQVVQKHIDEILAKETKLDDIDTKPGMMRILSKRVNEVEKELAKENRKEVDEKAPPGREDQVKALKKKFKDKSAPYAIAWAQHNKHGKPKNEADINERMPASIIKHKEKLAHMSDEELANRLKDFDEQRLRQMAWRHGYGKMSPHYLDRVRNVMTSKRTGTTEAELEEGKIKDWAKSLAMAGVFVAGLAGVGSINDAINNSVPAIQAMNTALEMAQDAGNDELAKMIEKDLKDAKLRLDIGKDLNQVKYLQDKYSKFMPTEGLAYESKLAILLNQRLK